MNEDNQRLNAFINRVAERAYLLMQKKARK